MPAVQLNKLKQQINTLIWKYTQPEAFLNELHDLLGYYANRVYRAGENVQHIYVGKIYHTPNIILNQIIIELLPLIEENPKRLLQIADVLWNDEYLEVRNLGILILGNIPPSEHSSVLSRIQEWVISTNNKNAIDTLLLEGTRNIRRFDPHNWLKQIENWLNDKNIEQQIIGLKATLPLILDPAFENFPPLFNMITPYFQHDNYQIQNEIFMIIDGLISRSPIETSFFFRQILSTGISRSQIRSIRKFLPRFDKEIQDALRHSITTAVITD